MVIKISPETHNPREVFHNGVNKFVKYFLKNRYLRYDLILILIRLSGDKYVKGNFYNEGVVKLCKANHPVDLNVITVLDELKNIYDKDTRNLDHYRGAIVEEIVFQLGERDCGSSHCYKECYIEINGWDTKKLYNIPIDIIVDTSKVMASGECFECKLSTKITRKKCKKQLDMLNQVYYISKKSFIPILATFAEERAFRINLKKLKINIGNCNVMDRASLIRQ
jgi:hypothetical protein